VRTHCLTALLLAAACLGAVASARAEMPYLKPLRRAQLRNWHGSYAYTPYGLPTAVVTPPTANLQTNWGWGAASSRISRIDHQFTRNYQGPGSPGPNLGTPYWPQDTTQFGLYYVRGPWYPTQP
jgi:hypothetical protein